MVDAIVIGAGVNGLTAAARLARSGVNVAVVDRRIAAGGLCSSEEFHTGYRTPGILHDSSRVSDRVIRTLELGQELRRVATRPDVYTPTEEGHDLLLQIGAADASQCGPHSSTELDRYRDWRAFLERVAPFLRQVIEEAPPALGAATLSAGWDWIKAVFGLRRLGQDDMRTLLRVATMSLADWLNEWFETEPLKAQLAGPAMVGAWGGPWSPGTTLPLLLHEALAQPPIAGGTPAVVTALKGACDAQAVRFELGVGVDSVLIEGGRVRGVHLENGHAIEGSCVIATCDPGQLFGRLVPPKWIPRGLATDVRAWRCRGTTAKVHMALSAPLEFSQRPGESFECIRIGERLSDLERAFDSTKYREYSRHPHLEIVVPTVADKELAPETRHVASILVHHVPYELSGGWTEAAGRALGGTVISQLARYVPDLVDRIEAMEVLTPADLAQRYSLPQGHIYHGEVALDQLFSLRPSHTCSRYETPISGLFVGGSSCHPGGAVTGLPGLLAAERVLFL